MNLPNLKCATSCTTACCKEWLFLTTCPSGSGVQSAKHLFGGILSPTAEERSQTQEPRMHPFLLAQSWRQQMEQDAKFNKARIATREGISRARVTQVMNLLQLPTEIQAGLLRPPAPLEMQSFSERRLRVLVSCGDEETQTARWRELVQELRSSAGN